MSLSNLKKKKNTFSLSFPQIHFLKLLALNSFYLKLSFQAFKNHRVLQRSKEHHFKLHSNTYNIIIQVFHELFTQKKKVFHEYYNITSLLC